MSFNEDAVIALQKIAAILEAQCPVSFAAPDLQAAPAFRWLVSRGVGRLEPVTNLAPLMLGDLLGIDRQKTEVERNTRQFLRGLPANNMLLTGARGTGNHRCCARCSIITLLTVCVLLKCSAIIWWICQKSFK